MESYQILDILILDGMIELIIYYFSEVIFSTIKPFDFC